jgi:hypothetical protein
LITGIVISRSYPSELFPNLWGLEGGAAATANGVVLNSVGLALCTWRRVGIYAPAIGLQRSPG